jgi:hypothetical protein
LKSYYEKHPGMKRERYPAVSGLFERVKYELVFAFNCHEDDVGHKITEIFGRDLTQDGKNTDQNKRAAFYDKLQLKLYRIRFKAGRAYQLRQNDKRGGMQFAPVNSADFFEAVNAVGAVRTPGWGPFVMTLEREFYMSMHTMKKASDNIFHSAYTRGGTVSGAGTMLIKNGQILGIRGDSGHYQPGENNMAMVITALGMYSVPLMPINVYHWKDGSVIGTALDFVRSRLTWAEFEAASKDFQSNRRIEAIRAGRMPRNTGPAHAPVLLPMADHEDKYLAE